MRDERPRRCCYTAVGDSFSAGVDGISPWPSIAADRLRGLVPNLSFHNFAAVGVTSRAVATEQLGPALALGPDLVSLVCGANDVLGSVRPDDAVFRRRFDVMLGRIDEVAPEAVVVTATYPPVAPGWLGPRTRQRVADGLIRFNYAVRELSVEHGALCLDWQDTEQADSESNRGADGFHPSREGHLVAAESFVEAVTPLLASDIRSGVT